LTIRRGRRLIGVLPLVLSPSRPRIAGVRRLSFLSSAMDEFEEICPEHLDVLCEQADAADCADAVASALGADRSRVWDELDLRDLEPSSPLLRLVQPLRQAGVRATEEPSDECHVIDLSGGFDAYVEGLSRNTRKAVRALRREVDSAGC